MRSRHVAKRGWNDDAGADEGAPAQTVIVSQADVQRQIAEASKETNETVGMSGSLSRVFSGGVSMQAGSGVQAISGGIRRTQIEPDGDLLVGSDIDEADGLSLAVFVNAQVWNAEEMEEGDLLIGDNSDGVGNVKYDKSEGQLQFRNGVIVGVYMDTDGSIAFGGGTGGLNESGIFIIAEGAPAAANAYKFVDADGDLVGGLYASTTGSSSFIYMRTQGINAVGNDQTATVDAVAPSTAQARLTADSGLFGGAAAMLILQQTATSTVIFQGVDTVDLQAEVRINEDKADKDTFIYGDNVLVVKVDAGLDRLEIGADHYFPTRSSSNTTTYFNEANQNMDVIIRGQTDEFLTHWDASANAVGIGNSASASYKLLVYGDFGVDGSAVFNVNGDVLNLAHYDSSAALQFISDASIGVGIGGAAESGYKLKVTGKLKVTEGILAETNSNNIYAVTSPGGPSLWTGTISGTPSGTSVTVSAPTSGTEAVLVPVSTSQLAKIRLYNLTRGNNALISNYNTGTNVVTLAATVPANWANGDSLTIVSQTVSGGGINWIDLEITSGITGKTSILTRVTLASATVAGNVLLFHPFTTFAASKTQRVDVQVSNVYINDTIPHQVVSNVFSIGWAGSISELYLREAGYLQ